MNQRNGALAAWTFALVTIACAGAALAADFTLPVAAPPEQGTTPAGFAAGVAFAAGLAMLAAGWGARLLKRDERAT